MSQDGELMSGMAGADGSNAPTGHNQTTTGTPGTMTAAANGGNGAPTSTATATATAPDASSAGKGAVPSTTGVCNGNPCAPNGLCGVSSSAPGKYECICDPGFEPDATGASCVTRNDCLKNNGGCEDACAPSAVGEAQCACTGKTRWLKGDAKQCAEALPAEGLNFGLGSVDRTRPQVAFDPMGNGVVVWTETGDDGTHSLWTARFRAETKQWEKPTRPFQLGTTEAADLHLALDANGSGVLLWTATVSARRQLWSARYSNNAFTLLGRVDKASAGDVLMPSLALDPIGDGLVVWTEAVYPQSTLRVASFNASTQTFSEVAMSSDGGGSFVFGTSVALSKKMSGLIAWTSVPVSTNADGGVQVEFTSANAMGLRLTADPLRNGAVLGRDDFASANPDVVMGADGRGVGVWLQATSSTANELSVLSKVYVPNTGWTALHTLSERGGMWSTPRVAIGPDGSAFTAWRESLGTPPATGPTTLLTRGALRSTDTFGSAYELGLPSDTTTWNDVDPNAWTAETWVTVLDRFQPNWTIAVGPNQTGFIAGASFDASATPATRQLWLQRMGAAQEPSVPILIADIDSVPNRPSGVNLGLNANGDGAVVWDRQIAGHYHVYASVLE
jgi:hypothetical protein